jgi:hypothetical protein
MALNPNIDRSNSVRKAGEELPVPDLDLIDRVLVRSP